MHHNHNQFKNIFYRMKNIFSLPKKTKSKEVRKQDILKLKELKEKIVIAIFTFGFVVELIAVPFALYLYFGEKFVDQTSYSDNIDSPHQVLVVDFNEEITTKTWYKIYSLFEDLKTNTQVDEIVLMMNTPGGSPTASEEIAAYLKSYKAKKIHLYVETIAASGGYYVASVLHPIVSNPNAIVGSIGVILPKYSLEQLSKQMGVEEDNIAVGKYKSPISLLRKAKEEDKKYLMDNLLLPTYDVFTKHVALNRNIPLKELQEKYAEGQIFAASHPLIQGVLVDKLENFTEFKERIINDMKKNNPNIDKVGFSFLLLDQLDSGSGFGFKGINLNVDVKNPGLLNQQIKIQ